MAVFDNAEIIKKLISEQYKVHLFLLNIIVNTDGERQKELIEKVRGSNNAGKELTNKALNDLMDMWLIKVIDECEDIINTLVSEDIKPEYWTTPIGAEVAVDLELINIKGHDLSILLTLYDKSPWIIEDVPLLDMSFLHDFEVLQHYHFCDIECDDMKWRYDITELGMKYACRSKVKQIKGQLNQGIEYPIN